jgi:hypothetical protein
VQAAPTKTRTGGGVANQVSELDRSDPMPWAKGRTTGVRRSISLTHIAGDGNDAVVSGRIGDRSAVE